MQHQTALVACDSYQPDAIDEALDQALSLVGALAWVRPGMRIVIKPNLLMRKRPDAACTTHPTLLAALTRRLIALGAVVVIGDSPGGPFTELMLRSVYEGTQMNALTQAGARLNYDVGVDTAAFAQGRVIRHIDVARFITQADAVISFAKLKTHTFMTYTGAVKNLFGVVPGTLKVEYHQRMPATVDFAGMLVDLAEYVQPRLSLIDGIVGMQGDGPSAGTPRHVGALVASTSPHHADLAAAALIGLGAQDVPTLRDAVQRGLCPASAAELELLGVPITTLAAPDFQLPGNTHAGEVFTGWRKRVLQMIFQSDPVVDAALCIGCAECKRACPPGAIALKQRLPQFNRRTCIHCYCCQELCPKGAIALRRTALASFLQRLG